MSIVFSATAVRTFNLHSCSSCSDYLTLIQFAFSVPPFENRYMHLEQLDSPPENLDVSWTSDGITTSPTWFSRGRDTNRVSLLYLSYLLQLMVTAMCPRHFGSQGTHRHPGAGGPGALWAMSSLRPLEAIFPHVLLGPSLPHSLKIRKAATTFQGD